MSHSFFVDLSAHRGETTPAIRKIEAWAKPYEAVETHWVGRQDQASELSGRSVVALDEGYSSSDIADKIIAFSQNGASGSVIHVLSYDGQVLGKASSLSTPDLLIVGHRLSDIVGVSGPPVRPALTPSPVRPAGLPGLSIEEAILLAKKALLAGGHTSFQKAMLLSGLRAAMSRLDMRATKDPSDPQSKSLIPDLRRVGAAQGLKVLMATTNPATGSQAEVIWLEEPGPAAMKAPMLRLEPAMPVPASTARVATKADGFSKYLFDEKIGTPALVRPYLFAALKELEADLAAQPRTAAQICAHLKQSAPKLALAEGIEKPEASWDMICRAFRDNLIGASVLLKQDGSPIPHQHGCHSTPVHKFHPDLENRALAFLVERVLIREKFVKDSEKYHLGLAVFQRGEKHKVEEHLLQELLDVLLCLLVSENRISRSADNDGYVAGKA